MSLLIFPAFTLVLLVEEQENIVKSNENTNKSLSMFNIINIILFFFRYFRDNVVTHLTSSVFAVSSQPSYFAFKLMDFFLLNTLKIQKNSLV